MTSGALFWLILGGCCAVVFFGIAAVVSVRGIGDLRHLLGSTGKQKETP